MAGHVAGGKNYDSAFCGGIPLHLVNLIQPHGLLLVLDKTGFGIIQASQNVAAWFAVPAEDLLDQPLSQGFTDLSDCNLRSVAKVHLEYLANMNVMASMSLPIIIEDRLWGLVCCHHKPPQNPGYELRSAPELLAGIFSAQVAAREKEAALARALRSTVLEKIVRDNY
jgi:light-regulated signal transduction histidine kinase (bacteriophytochrome)